MHEEFNIEYDVPDISAFDKVYNNYRETYFENHGSMPLKSTKFQKRFELFKRAKGAIKDFNEYKIMRRIYKQIGSDIDEKYYVSGYRLYKYRPNTIKFWQFFMLKAAYDSMEIMSYSDFRLEYYANLYDPSTDDVDFLYGGFPGSRYRSLYDSIDYKCKKLYQLPYPHKLLLLTVRKLARERGYDIRFANYICHTVKMIDNFMKCQYNEVSTSTLDVLITQSNQ